MRRIILSFVALSLVAFALDVRGADTPAANASAPDYVKDIAPILTKYCAGCHNADEFKGELDMTSFASLQKGSVTGPVLTPGSAASSRLIWFLA